MAELLTETRYHDVVIAFCTVAGRTSMVVVPNVKKLTTARQLWIARRVWSSAGNDPDVFDRAPESEQLRYARTHMGKYGYVIVKAYDDDTVSYTTPTSGGVGHDLADFLVVDLKGNILRFV